MEFHWSGQIIEPIDGLAFIGRNPGDKNIYVATGDSGNGMTHGTIAGILLTDLILGRENEWETLYDPSRISLRAAPEFARENLNVLVQYSDYATPGDLDQVREIPAGTGALVRQELKKLAVYRDSHGSLHKRSAICPHLGCIWLGTTPKKLGIAPATDLASTLTAKFLTVQQTRTSSPWAIKRWRMRCSRSTFLS